MVVFPQCQSSIHYGKIRIGYRLVSTSTSPVFFIPEIGMRIRTGAHMREQSSGAVMGLSMDGACVGAHVRAACDTH